MTTAKDITGQRSGRLVAIRPTDQRQGKYIVWECACDCGNTAYAKSSVIIGNYKKSCGCLTRAIDMSGQRFGRLVAVRPTDARCGKFIIWECRCDCGETANVSGSALRQGFTKSCGCLRRETTIKRFTTHRMGGTPTHKSWTHMLYRCNTPTSKKYPLYGGRGIKVCNRWHKFENFLADMGERPAGTTIDRIDNDQGYFPGNCRWADHHTQRMNQRRMI